MASPAPRDPLAVVLPVRNLGDRAGGYFAKWVEGLAKLGRPFTLLIVDDVSTDATAARAESLAAADPRVRLLRRESAGGFGACLKTALPDATHPLLLYVAADYPYEPADVRKVLEVYGKEDEYTKLTVRVVNGCRCGRPKPPAWSFPGRIVRTVSRYVLGNPLEPLPGWLGLGNHLYSWFAWIVFGDPFIDPNSGFKLFDRTLFDRFVIQSDGDFVHTELVGKATFLTTLMSEVPLTPKPDPIPSCRFGKDLGQVYRHPKFVHPEPQPDPVPEPAPPPAPA